ncbi:MAG: CBS domain-containing protein [Desulfosarcinaceae bacterium]|nr:CBS domain-containing protein [Desulfosarcinaceae bacterium]
MKTAADIIKEKNREMVCIDHDKSVADAVQQMVAQKIGAILVRKEGRLVGIYSERDLLRHMAAPGFDPAKAPIVEFMTSPLCTAAHDTSLTRLTEIFLGRFIRHIVIEEGEQPIGMLSIGDALRASLLAQDQKIKELNAIASWEYYENWGWDRKKR